MNRVERWVVQVICQVQTPRELTLVAESGPLRSTLSTQPPTRARTSQVHPVPYTKFGSYRGCLVAVKMLHTSHHHVEVLFIKQFHLTNCCFTSFFLRVMPNTHRRVPTPTWRNCRVESRRRRRCESYLHTDTNRKFIGAQLPNPHWGGTAPSQSPPLWLNTCLLHWNSGTLAVAEALKCGTMDAQRGR